MNPSDFQVRHFSLTQNGGLTMTLLDHARTELEIIQRSADADEGRPDDFQRAINEHLLAMVALFSEEGHYEPLTPLTGDDSEWMDVTSGPDQPGLQQNVRCGRVFREDGIAYDIDAVVYRERNGGGFTGWDSRRQITFPYVPKTRSVPAWLRRPERLVARLRRQLVK